jgi:hypothetical protein
MGLFLHKVYQLMSEKGLTYNEACREVGTHGAKRKRAIRRRRAGKWISAKTMETKPVNISPHYQLGPAEHHFEQSFLDFN